MKKILEQAKNLGNTVKIISENREYIGKIAEVCDDVVSLIVAERYDPNTGRLTQQTKAVILIESITCVFVTVGDQ
ncbi:MAG: hypothetical protein ACEQSC_00505 [Candidatus Nanopelagicaceae bacterium]